MRKHALRFFTIPIVDAAAAALKERVGPGVIIPRFPAPDRMTKLAAARLGAQLHRSHSETGYGQPAAGNWQ
jgi:hypothetical protein